MRQDFFGIAARRAAVAFFICSVFAIGAIRCTAQTTQPFLFAATNNSSSGATTGFVSLLRDSTTGVVTLLPNTNVSFNDSCMPTAIDATGSFLFSLCGAGLAMYTLDATSGLVAEVPASPFIESDIAGETGVLIAPESTGQYVYLLKIGFSTSEEPSTFTLDTFQIDATTPQLVPVGTQTLPINGAWVASAADPADHGMVIFANQPPQSGASPAAILFVISFDPSTGAASVPATGLTIGNTARNLAMSPASGYMALGYGDTDGQLAVFQISTGDSSTPFSLTQVGVSVDLGPEVVGSDTLNFPSSLYFSPGGNLLYVQAPSSGSGSTTDFPYQVFDPTTATLLASAPIPVSQSGFLQGVADPQAPFTYTSNSAPSFGISVYQVDLSTGVPSQPAALSAPFLTPQDLTPLFVTVQQGGEGIQAPTLGINPGTLAFPSTTAGQSSTPQSIVLKSLGSASVTFSSIQISGTNAADFSEADTCVSTPVLATNHTCTISIVYAPSTVGTSQATLFVTDNATGSPQGIPLSGTAVAPAPAAPAVTLNPASALTFPGTPTQGTSSSPQTVTLTNSGGASLQILSAVLSGFNTADFSISADTCSGSIAASATCTISMVFSPQASGIRTTSLTITDNAANSPQSISVTGTAIPAATVAGQNGSTTATVTAGQTAQFNLQATPGAGFTGTLTFACSGAPFGATCTVPTSVSVSNGASAAFTVSISTLGASQAAAAVHSAFAYDVHIPNGGASASITPAIRTLSIVSVLLALLCCFELRRRRNPVAQILSTTACVALSLLILSSGIGCNASSRGGSSTQVTPAGQSAAVPGIQPAPGTYGAAQTISITDATAGATIYYTTDGSTPTSASPVYSSSFTLNSTTTVNAMATASGDSNSAPATAAYTFRTPAGSFPITINITATPAASGKPLQLAPITLTLVVN